MKFGNTNGLKLISGPIKKENMEIICVDGKFQAEILQFYIEHGVITPQAKSPYNIREVVKHTNGEIGFRLEEIVNPEVPIKHPILGITNMEPSWAQRRFTTLDGRPLNREEIEVLIKQPIRILEPSN